MPNQSASTQDLKTKARHSAGKWTRVDTRIYSDFTIDGHPSSKFVASTDCSPDYAPIAEQIANAQLIVAAPALLAALQKIDANAAESVEWIRRVARAAIQSATL